MLLKYLKYKLYCIFKGDEYMTALEIDAFVTVVKTGSITAAAEQFI